MLFDKDHIIAERSDPPVTGKWLMTPVEFA
jgi:hypothetical protein